MPRLSLSCLALLAAVAVPGLVAPAAAQPGPTVSVAPPPPPPRPESMGIVQAPPRRAQSAPAFSGPPTFQGTLTDNDPTRDGDTPVDTYSTDVRDGDEVTVTMTADDFDTYLIVRSPGGQEWSNDDFGSTRVSQVTFRATEAGRYTVLATAYSSSGRGDYEVLVASVRAVVLSTVAGRLDYQDQQQIKGEYFDEVTVQAPARGTFYIELVPLGFSGFLRVTSPGGIITRSTSQRYDASPSMRLGPFQAERGAWRVDVTSEGGNSMVGAYDLRVVTIEE